MPLKISAKHPSEDAKTFNLLTNCVYSLFFFIFLPRISAYTAKTNSALRRGRIRMPYISKKHPTLPIVMRIYDESFSMGSIDPRIAMEDAALINAQPQPTYYLADLRDVKMSFEEIMKASNLAAAKSETYTNPNVIESLVIVPNRILEAAAQGLTSPAFGRLRIKPFRSIEEAEAYVEEQLKRKVS